MNKRHDKLTLTLGMVMLLAVTMACVFLPQDLWESSGSGSNEEAFATGYASRFEDTETPQPTATPDQSGSNADPSQPTTEPTEAGDETEYDLTHWYDLSECNNFVGLVPSWVNNWYSVDNWTAIGQAKLTCRVDTEEYREEPCGPGTSIFCRYKPGGLNVWLTAYASDEVARETWSGMRANCPFSAYAESSELSADECLEQTEIQDDDYGTLIWRQITGIHGNMIYQIMQVDLQSPFIVYDALDIAIDINEAYRYLQEDTP